MALHPQAGQQPVKITLSNRATSHKLFDTDKNMIFSSVAYFSCTYFPNIAAHFAI